MRKYCYFGIALLGTSLMIPAAASAQQGKTPQPATQQAAQGQGATNDCDQLIATLNQRQSEQLPVTMDQAKQYQSSGNMDACRQASAALQGAGQPADQQQAAGQAGKVLVQQPAPQVKVQQAAPQVTVTQGQPQIEIHQPAPTITVDIPQPEIVVRMANPQVAVSQQKPQVEVQQAKPQVAVTEQSNGQSNVQLQQTGQPAVQYKAEQPKVVINQPKEQPKVRFEQTTGEAAQSGQVEQQANASNGATGNAGQTATEQQQASAGGLQNIRVSQLKQMPVVSDSGDNLGTIDAVVVKSGTKDGFIILHAGQFLGIGDKLVAVPLTNVLLRNNEIMINGLTNDQIGSLSEWKNGDKNFQALTDDQNAAVKTAG